MLMEVGLINHNAQAELFNTVSLSVEHIAQLSSQRTRVNELFKNVSILLETVKRIKHILDPQ